VVFQGGFEITLSHSPKNWEENMETVSKELSKELTRAAIASPLEIELQEDRLQLLEAAARTLGYTQHATVVQKQQMAQTRHDQLLKLKAACEKLGIEPYSPESVARYKAKKLRQANRKYWLRNYVNSEFGQGLMIFSAIYGIVMTVVALAVEGGMSGGGTKLAFGECHPHIMFPLIYSGLLGIAYWWTSAILRNIVLDHRRFLHKWDHTRIRYYGGLVPDFALSHAVALARELSLDGEQFSVERLTLDVQESSRLSFDPDPFLVLSYAREPFYLDVWDERDFEKEN